MRCLAALTIKIVSHHGTPKGSCIIVYAGYESLGNIPFIRKRERPKARKRTRTGKRNRFNQSHTLKFRVSEKIGLRHRGVSVTAIRLSARLRCNYRDLFFTTLAFPPSFSSFLSPSSTLLLNSFYSMPRSHNITPDKDTAQRFFYTMIQAWDPIIYDIINDRIPTSYCQYASRLGFFPVQSVIDRVTFSMIVKRIESLVFLGLCGIQQFAPERPILPSEFPLWPLQNSVGPLLLHLCDYNGQTKYTIWETIGDIAKAEVLRYVFPSRICLRLQFANKRKRQKDLYFSNPTPQGNSPGQHAEKRRRTGER